MSPMGAYVTSAMVSEQARNWILNLYLVSAKRSAQCEECAELQSLILTKVKKISDVGLRYLAEGCHHLQYLNGSFISITFSLLSTSSI